MDRCTNAERYLELESDFLHFDDHEFERKFGDRKSNAIRIGTDNRLKSLALRVVAFVQTRAALQKGGFALPPNPDLEEAIYAVRAELAKDARAQAQFAQLLDEKPSRRLKGTEEHDR